MAGEAGSLSNGLQEPLAKKYEGLLSYLREQGRIAVAFSGGVDSTFLLYAAREALKDRVLAVTVRSGLCAGRELEEAKDFCESLFAEHAVLDVDVFKIEGFASNPPDRCYLCKRQIFMRMKDFVVQKGIQVLADGSNLDDTGDYRPGLKALQELGIKSPLKELGFTKSEIRALSKRFGLPTWNKPSFACLASRVPYKEAITPQKLEMVDNAENLLHDLGFKQYRVRIHGDLARIELDPSDFTAFMNKEIRLEVYTKFKSFGFTYVALDICGYRTGSLNESLSETNL